MKMVLVFFYSLSFLPAWSQNNMISGRVTDATDGQALPDVSILIFTGSHVSGGVSNKEGKFLFYSTVVPDSIQFSSIGYQLITIRAGNNISPASFIVKLFAEPVKLAEIEVRPPGTMKILSEAVKKIISSIPTENFENKAFYREIIRDSQFYYSVAEALFRVQISPARKKSKLMLMKGRSKEDVSYTRLFEDFHPGGGPQDAINMSFATSRPDFLNENRFANYNYKKEPSVSINGRKIFVIRFDQKPEIKEALESGRIYIAADNYSIIKFEAENSVAGTPYIKSLKGSDKIFAELLHVDFKIKGWSRTASFSEIQNWTFLNYASNTYKIGYQQPKKNIHLDLDIHCELVITDFSDSSGKEIQKDETWKRKNLVANLPSAFDSAFWGTNNILTPTLENIHILKLISDKNGEIQSADTLKGWNYLHTDYFQSYESGDSLCLTALMKSNWEGDETGGMLYKSIHGDFNMEARIDLLKRSNRNQNPDNGFQQVGLIVRNPLDDSENNLIFSLGTGGSNTAKYFLKRTLSGKTKGVTDKADGFTGWLRMEHKGNQIVLYKKEMEKDAWQKLEDYQLTWLSEEVQLGFSVMAKFAGDGPKQHPDMKAIITNIKIESR
jgi:hypothetical protein